MWFPWNKVSVVAVTRKYKKRKEKKKTEMDKLK